MLLPPAGDLLQVVTNAGHYSRLAPFSLAHHHIRFLDLVSTTNLTSQLSAPHTTLLLPLDAAFSSLPETVTTRLQEDADFARRTVLRHLLKEVKVVALCNSLARCSAVLEFRGTPCSLIQPRNVLLQET